MRMNNWNENNDDGEWLMIIEICLIAKAKKLTIYDEHVELGK